MTKDTIGEYAQVLKDAGERTLDKFYLNVFNKVPEKVLSKLVFKMLKNVESKTVKND